MECKNKDANGNACHYCECNPTVAIEEEQELLEELTRLILRKEELENCDNEEEYDEALNEGEDIVICGMSYTVAKVLSEVDPIAYRCGHTDFNDSLLSETEDEIDDINTQIDELRQAK